MGADVHLGFKKPAKLQAPLGKLPIKVIYTCTGSTTTSASTCGSHLSQMGVTTPRNMSSTSIICRGPWGPHAMPYTH